MSKVSLAKVFGLVLLGILLLSGPVAGSSDTFSGDWESELSLFPEAESMISLKSTLDLRYSEPGMSFGSVSKFEENDLEEQRFRGGLTTGPFEGSSLLSLDISGDRTLPLNYWLSDTWFSLGGVDVANSFLLEYVDKLSAYGAGFKFSISGELGGESRIYVDNYFGMEENEAEALGLKDGSGYTIVTDDGRYGPSELQYVETRVEVTGLEFECCSFHSTAKLSEEKGFEFALFEFVMESEDLPLELDSDLKFTPKEKSLELKPRLDLDWACLDVYTGLRTSDDENLLVGGQNDSIEGVSIEGFGISGLSYGGVELSGLTALDGRLFKLDGESNLDLRADDYVLNPDPVYTNLYDRTDYDGVVSVEKSGRDQPLSVAVDSYFESDGGEGPFDFALFTGEGNYRFSEQFSLGAGVEVGADTVKRVRLSVDYGF